MSIATDEAGLPAKTAFKIRNDAAYEWMKEKTLTEGVGTGHETTREPTQEEHAFGTWGFTAGAEWEARREPTEAEIEAADEALLQAYRDNSNMLTNREAVHIVLEAARKAVKL